MSAQLMHTLCSTRMHDTCTGCIACIISRSDCASISTVSLRWEDYKKFRLQRGLKVVGSKGLFEKIWREHDEIVQYGSIGHPKCPTCGKLEAQRDSIGERTDRAAAALRAELDAADAAHAAEHMGERNYAEQAWYIGETYPKRMTCIRIDAPTQHQFDVPRQRKIARDIVKTLEGSRRWMSKITGSQIAGVGMLATVARIALGGGPNLVCTVLMLSLMAMMEKGHPIGARLMLVLDNTTGENKNSTVIGFLACLVAWDWFEETGFFSQPVGHTYNELDQSFNTLIKKMMQYAVYTVSKMVALIFKFLEPYGVFAVIELPYLWDFTAMVQPHMNPLGGFATSQFGEGMHEFRFKKDRNGVVRLHMRQSSQASGYYMQEMMMCLSHGPYLARTQLSSNQHRTECECTLRAHAHTSDIIGCYAVHSGGSPKAQATRCSSQCH